MKALDVIRYRSQMQDYFYPPDKHDPEAKLTEGLRRVFLAVEAIGQSLTDPEAMILPIVAYTLNQEPEHTAINYCLEGKLTETVDRIAEAFPDDMLIGQVPPPTAAGFCVLAEPLRWVDVWGHECAANLVTWAPAQHPVDLAVYTTVILWTNERTGQVRDLHRDWELHTIRGWQQMTRGWHAARVVMCPPELKVGEPGFTLTEEEIAKGSSDRDPVTHPWVPNFDRKMLALWAVLAGADAPGKDREVEKVTEQPGKALAKTARKRRVPGAVSFVYAGAHRTPTPPENVGSRGPIGVRYWREGFSKRVVRPDGSVAIRKRRGTWVNDHKPWLPVSDRTKVRIASGTLARPSDYLPES